MALLKRIVHRVFFLYHSQSLEDKNTDGICYHLMMAFINIKFTKKQKVIIHLWLLSIYLFSIHSSWRHCILKPLSYSHIILVHKFKKNLKRQVVVVVVVVVAVVVSSRRSCSSGSHNTIVVVAVVVEVVVVVVSSRRRCSSGSHNTIVVVVAVVVVVLRIVVVAAFVCYVDLCSQ